MRLVDAHVHAWGADTADLPWQAPILPPGWSGSYTHRDLVADMDSVGVDESVIVTTPLYGRGERANEYTIRSIEAHPDRLYGVAIVDFFPEDGSARDAVRRAVAHDQMLGVRFHAAMTYAEFPTEIDRTGEWFLDDRLEPVWEELARLDKSAFVFPKAQQLPAVETLVETHPDVTFVVDHMAWPDETTAPGETPWTRFRELAENRNVLVKVSSVPRSATTDWPYPDMHEYLRQLLDWFGPERLLAGSDYPWMDDWATYGECLSWFRNVDFLSRRDRAFLSYRTFDESLR